MKSAQSGAASASNVGSLMPAASSFIASAPLVHRVAFAFLSVGAVFYLLFQKKLLPKPVAKVVSKILFYPTFPITALLRLGNYWTPVDDTLVLGCAPMGFLGHPKSFADMGIKGVVNMCYEYNGPKGHYNTLGIKQLHLPTVDHTEPSADNLEKAVAFIKQYKERGERVYVHCKAGHGRAASVALSWLIHENPEMSVKDLNAVLRSKRKVRGTLYQQKTILEYVERVKSKRDVKK